MLWTEQQAKALRDLGQSNVLDIVHLADEIEDLGRRDLHDVESLIAQIYCHVMKFSAEPEAAAVRHWKAEVVKFQAQVRRRFAPSMRQKLDLDGVWSDAVRQFAVGTRPDGSDGLIVYWKLKGPPGDIDELAARSFDVERFVAAVEVAGV